MPVAHFAWRYPFRDLPLGEFVVTHAPALRRSDAPTLRRSAAMGGRYRQQAFALWAVLLLSAGYAARRGAVAGVRARGWV